MSTDEDHEADGAHDDTLRCPPIGLPLGLGGLWGRPRVPGV